MRTFSIISIWLLSTLSIIAQEENEAPNGDGIPEVYSPRGDEVVTPAGDISLFTDEGTALGMAVTILGYLIILGCIALGVWILFKRGAFQKKEASAEGKLQIVDRKVLGGRQFLMVVEYEDQKVLLGVGPGKIDYLTNLTGYRNDFPELEPQAQEVSGKQFSA